MALSPELAAAARAVLERHPEVRLALLFGSRARGVAAPGADLDVAVEVARGQELDRLGLMRELSRATRLEVDVVDVSPGRRVGFPLLNAVSRDAVTLFEGTPNAEAEFRTRALLQTSLDRPAFERMRDGYLLHLATASDG